MLGSPDTQLKPITDLADGTIVAESGVMRKYKMEVGKEPVEKSRVFLDGARYSNLLKAKGMFVPQPSFSTNPPMILKKWFLAKLTRPRAVAGTMDFLRMTMVKGDLANAYRKARTARTKRAMRAPLHLREYDANGDELVVEFDGYAFWGEKVAGNEWDVEFDKARLKIGWRRCEGAPGLWTFGNCMMIGEVDDFAIGEPEEDTYAVSARTIHLLDLHFRRAGETCALTYEACPQQYAGLELAIADGFKRITIRMRQKVLDACRAHIPLVVDGGAIAAREMGLLTGKKLRDALDALALAPPPPLPASIDSLTSKLKKPKLNVEQQSFQSATGAITYFTEVMPRFEKSRNHLSTVSSRPAKGSYLVAQSVLSESLAKIDDGITYGSELDEDEPWRPSMPAAAGELRRIGDGVDEGHGGASGVILAAGAPTKPEGHADATWGKLKPGLTEANLQTAADLRKASADLYSYVITASKGSLATRTKRLTVATSCSMAAERVASNKVTEVIDYLTNAEQATGTPMEQPILVTTDNHANQLVIEGEQSATRSRHELRRYIMLQQRVANGQILMRHVRDTENPADFLTKWLELNKFEASLEYVSNSRNAVKETSPSYRQQQNDRLLTALAKCEREDDNAAIAANSKTARIVNLIGDVAYA